MGAATSAVLDPHGSIAFEHNLVGLGQREQGEVCSVKHRVQVRTGGAQATASDHVLVEDRETFLLVAVHVARAVETGLRASFEPRVEQWIPGRSGLELERAVLASPFVAANQAIFHSFEVRQAVLVRPVLHTRLGGPLVIIHGITPLEDHAVDAAAAAKDLATSVIHLAAVHERLGFALVLPVVEPAADRVGQRRWHVDEDIPLPVLAPRFDHQHFVGRVGAQSVCQRTPSGPTADDDVVIGLVGNYVTHFLQRT